jgi:uncharacterized membrane protein YgcG
VLEEYETLLNAVMKVRSPHLEPEAVACEPNLGGVSGQPPEVVGGLKPAEGVELLRAEQVDDGQLGGKEGRGGRDGGGGRGGGGGGKYSLTAI